MAMPQGITTATEINAATMPVLLARFNELNTYVNGAECLPTKRFSDLENARRRVTNIVKQAQEKDAKDAAPAKKEKAVKAKAEKVAAAPAKKEKAVKAKAEPKERKARENAINAACNPAIVLLSDEHAETMVKRAHEASRRSAVFAQIGDSDSKFKIKYEDGTTRTGKGILFNDLQKQFPEYDVRPYLSKMVVTGRIEIAFNFTDVTK